MQLPIEEIVIGKRIRQDYGDVHALAESIRLVGLLHPIAINEQCRLIAGARRLRAVQQLGWDKVEVTICRSVDDATKAILAERDENSCRLDLNPIEKNAVIRAVLAVEVPEAKKRHKSNTGGRPPKNSRENFPRVFQDNDKRALARAAKAVGWSYRTAAKSLAVEKSGEDEVIESMVKTGKVDGAFKELERRKAQSERQQRAQSAKRVAGSSDHGIVVGDFRKQAVAPASVDLIFADPPYDRKSLGLYGDLAQFAASALVDGGSLLAYAGQYLLADILPLMTPHLRLWWICGCRHTGKLARMNEYGIVVHWKPIIWLVKGTRRDKLTFVDDLVEGSREKAHHDWQQSEIEAAYFIEKLTDAGELICDPFCGGGTTSVVAKRTARRWLSFEIDPKSAAIARKRVMEAKP